MHSWVDHNELSRGIAKRVGHTSIHKAVILTSILGGSLKSMKVVRAFTELALCYFVAEFASLLV